MVRVLVEEVLRVLDSSANAVLVPLVLLVVVLDVEVVVVTVEVDDVVVVTVEVDVVEVVPRFGATFP